MPIHWAEVAEGAGLVLRGEGQVTGAELIATNQKILALTDTPRDWVFGMLDLTTVDSFECSTAELRRISGQDRALAARMRSGALVCIAASDKFVFGLARMWQVFSHDTGWRTRVVRTREEAESWIQKEAAVSFGVTLPSQPFQAD